MPRRLSLTKALLGSLIGALCLSALVGIYMFVMGDFGETEVKILITTLSLAYFSVTSLGCIVVVERRRALWLAVPGLLASAWGFLWSLPLIWAEWYPELPGKTMAILVLFAFSFAQASLLALPRLRGRAAWVFPAALVCIFGLAVLLSAMLVFELEDELLFRLAGVLGILDAAATLSIPILHKLRGEAIPEQLPAGQGQKGQKWRVQLTCPRCGHQDVYPEGTIACPECGLTFRLAVLDGPAPVENRRFQFSLKSMLMVFTLVALPLGWIGFRLRERAEQAQAAEALEAHGANVRYRYGNVDMVTFSFANQFDAAVLAQLKKLPRLRTLSFRGIPLTDRDLRYIEHLGIEYLDLQDTQVTDAGVDSLATLGELRHLDVRRTRVTQQGVQRLTDAAPKPHVQVDPPPGTQPGEGEEAPLSASQRAEQ